MSGVIYYLIRKRVLHGARAHKIKHIGDGHYHDLLNTIEGEVQQILQEAGIDYM